MKYFDKYIDTEEVKAETWVSLKDIDKNLDVIMCGIFSRNYDNDLLSFKREKGKKTEEDKTILELSHDGIFHLLPEGLFFKENRLKNIPKNEFGKEYDRFKKEKEKIESFFLPFDTEYFKLSLKLEKKLNAIAEIGNNIFFEDFSFRFALLPMTSPLMDKKEQEETHADNKYISKIKTILPFVRHLKGNIELLREILKNVLSVEKPVQKIGFDKVAPFHGRFIIHVEKLSKDEYEKMDKELYVFFKFFKEWFLPVEMEYDYRIRDYKESFILGNTLLDYNTNL